METIGLWWSDSDQFQRIHNSHEYCNFMTELFYYIHTSHNFATLLWPARQERRFEERKPNKAEVEEGKEILN